MNRAAQLSIYGGAKAAVKYPPHLLEMAGAQRWNIPDPEVYENQADLYRRLSWLMSAISIVSTTAALQPLNVKQMQGEDTVDIPNHDFETLLLHPNPLQSRFEFLQSTFGYRKLNGNAFWWQNKPGGEKAAPSELWVVPPYRIQPIPDEKLYLKGYWYYPGNGEKIFLEPWEIVHFHAFNPANEFMGLSDVEPLAVVAATDLEKQDWQARLYGDSNARMPGILAFADPLNDQQMEMIKRDIASNTKKRDFMMLRNVGKGGVEWMQASNTLQEMEYGEGRKLTKEEIFIIVAPGLASMTDVNSTEANSKAGKQTFLEFCIWPMLVSAHEKITSDVLPAYGENLIAEFEDPRQVDRIIELREQNTYSRTHTINEIRKEYYGDDPLEDDRGLLLPAQIGGGQIPLNVATGEEPEPVPAALQPFQQGPTTTQQPPAEEEEVVEEEPEEEGEPSEEVKAEMKRWRRASLQAFRKGHPLPVDWIVEAIPDHRSREIANRLTVAKSVDDIEWAFAMKSESDINAELTRWRHMALKSLAAGRPAHVPFTSDIIPLTTQAAIVGALEECKTQQDIIMVFADRWTGYP